MKKRILFLMLFVIMLFKYGYFGFKYYPVLDDWIQYGGYTQYNNIFKDVIIRVGTYATRPAASFSDPYIWGRFWPDMGYVFLIITLLHFLSFILIYKILRHFNIEIGVMFFSVFCLLPLGTEATYWISASSRLVVGIFFMSLSLYFIIKYLKNINKAYIFLFFIFNLISLCYYEQITLLSFVAAVIILFLERKNIKHKYIFFIPFINIIIVGTYYKICSSIGNLAVRGSIVKTNNINHYMIVFDKITDVWGRVHIPLMKNGFIRGLKLLLENKSYIFFILMLLLISLITWSTYKGKTENQTMGKNLYIIIIGAVLFWIPYIPNAILETVWISNRNVFPSFIGLALIAEGIFLTIRNNSFGRVFKASIVFITVFIFLIVNISEINDYKNASLIDKKICQGIIEKSDDKNFRNGIKKIYVFNTLPYYIEQNSFYHDHILNVTSSDWALTGGVRAIAENIKIKYLTPVKNGEKFEFNNNIDTELLGINENLEVISLFISTQEDVKYLKDKDGKLFGKIEDQVFNIIH